MCSQEDGPTSLAATYAALVFSSLFLPTFLISKLTAKGTIVASMLCYSTYIAAQFYPTYYTLIPSAVLVGLAAAPLWSAKCTYVTHVGKRYEKSRNLALFILNTTRIEFVPGCVILPPVTDTQSMLRPLVITQLLHLPWARNQVISGFLAQGMRRSCIITNDFNIL